METYRQTRLGNWQPSIDLAACRTTPSRTSRRSATPRDWSGCGCPATRSRTWPRWAAWSNCAGCGSTRQRRPGRRHWCRLPGAGRHRCGSSGSRRSERWEGGGFAYPVARGTLWETGASRGDLAAAGNAVGAAAQWQSSGFRLQGSLTESRSFRAPASVLLNAAPIRSPLIGQAQQALMDGGIVVAPVVHQRRSRIRHCRGPGVSGARARQQGRRGNRGIVGMAAAGAEAQTEEEMSKTNRAGELRLAGAGTTLCKWPERVGKRGFLVYLDPELLHQVKTVAVLSERRCSKLGWRRWRPWWLRAARSRGRNASYSAVRTLWVSTVSCVFGNRETRGNAGLRSCNR